MEKFVRSDCLPASCGHDSIAQCVVNSVEEYVQTIVKSYDEYERTSLRIPPTNQRLFFRGHSNISWDLLPPVFRGGELNYSRNEKSIVLDYKQYAVPDDCYDGSEKMLCDMQHYGIPTRLLDWTVDPLSALYFALCDKSEAEADGCVWIIDPWDWNASIGCKYEAQEHDANVRARALLAYHWKESDICMYLKRKGMPDSIDISRPYAEVGTFTNMRKIAQNGSFMIWGKEVGDLRRIKLFRDRALMVIIPSEAKKEIRRNLHLLGVNSYSIYPDEKGFSEVIKAYGSLYSIRLRHSSIEL